MSQISFSSEWLSQLSDPYAVLGLSVAADERRVLKRYHTIAKLLHPDTLIAADPAIQTLAGHILAKLVNPAYQRLKQEKERAETIALLRLRVRQMNQDESLLPQGAMARQLLRLPLQEADVFYEQSVVQLGEVQYRQLAKFEATTRQLAELNLTYLSLKIGDPVIREKRTGIVAAPQTKPTQFAPSQTETPQVAINYAQRHYYRAQEYAKKSNWTQVVAELRDAIRLESNRSEYHSLLAKAYLMQNLVGMAKVHFRQALKFNPNDPLALQYAKRLDLTDPGPKATARASSGLFSLFTRKR
ncbi:J domain-containing protein [Leptolyngbya sp. NK1-12]|uniref:J domain-containing protein n=1 Tax=Leptolyngbya sp. NK1-12 TaxID=2547451 RepID=A0AA96WU46_9CYAN|nr:J domain-containing protein [Leptolyngbya sp. NK1-12]MBF2049140.1 J domain-containing protein [Elainella sp. C42_A2020_010]WNZ23202.1 J domain-containing protein [Leptolyngbya sp. NK1-12]